MTPKIKQKSYKKRKRKAIYLRVSREENESIENHEAMLIELCQKEGIDLADVDIYKEEALSGANLNRPQLEALMSNLEAYDTVIAKDIDRLSRDDSQALENKRLFWINDVEILTPSRRYNFDKESDEMMYGLESMFAKMELRKIKQRFKDGKVNNAKAGKWTAGPTPIGYTRGADGSLLVDPESAVIVMTIFEMSAQGIGLKRIRDTLFEQDLIGKDKKYLLPPPHLRTILRNRVYLGEISFTNYDARGEVLEEVVVPDAHPPLVSLELFVKANAEVERRTKNKGTPKGKVNSYLHGLLRCKTCGYCIGTYFADVQGVPSLRYKKCARSECEKPQTGISAEYVDALFETELFKFREYLREALVHHSSESTEAKIKAVEEELANVKKELSKIEIKKERILDMYQDGDISKEERKERLKKVGKNEQTLRDTQKILQEKLSDTVANNNHEALTILLEKLDRFYDLTITEKHDVVANLIDKIEYERDTEGRKAGKGQAEEFLRMYPPRLTIHWREPRI